MRLRHPRVPQNHGGRIQNTYYFAEAPELMHEALREPQRSPDARVHEPLFFSFSGPTETNFIDYSPPTTFSSAAGDAGENSTWPIPFTPCGR